MLSAGELDPSFGDGGKVVSDLGLLVSNSDFGRSVMAVQADGKIVVAGQSQGASTNYLALARYHSDGSVDTSFGTGGTVSATVSTAHVYAYGMSVDDAGKIIVVGSSQDPMGDDILLVRYDADGSLDSSFGVDGVVTTDFGGRDRGYDVVIDDAGRIVVAGSTQNSISFTTEFLLARYHADGSLDTTFDLDGKVTTAFGSNSYAIAESLAIDGSGKIVLAGRSNNDFALARYNPDGSLDTTFDVDGRVTTDFGSGSQYSTSTAYGVTFDNAGNILAGGDAYISGSGTGRDLALARYRSDGSPDTSFGTNGKVMTDFAGGTDSGQAGIALDINGKIVVAGYSRVGGLPANFALARYNSNGSLDTSFDSDGRVTTDFVSLWDYAYSVTTGPDGKIIVAGGSHGGSSTLYDFALARYTASGSLDSTFGVGGKVTTDFLGPTSDEAEDLVAVQSDGKLIVVGSARGATGSDFALARYNVDGTLDPSFGVDGKVTTDFGGRWARATSVVIDATGKIAVAGGFSAGNYSQDFAVARYNGDGSLDETFGQGGKVTTDFAAPNSHYSYETANDLAIQSDGKIVLVGYVNSNPSSTGVDIALARYDSNGALDTSFGVGGKITTDFAGSHDYGNSIAIGSAGKIFVAGISNQGQATKNDFALARYHPNGTLDTSFGAGGKVTTDFGSGYDWASDIAIDGDGKILVGGDVQDVDLGLWDLALARYEPSGILDSTFGSGGKVIADFGYGGDESAYAIAIQDDGKIVTAGWLYVERPDGWWDGDFAIARFNPDGSPDTEFGTEGHTITDFGSYDDYAYGVAVQADGNIVAAGATSRSATGYDIALARYLGASDIAPPVIESADVGSDLRSLIVQLNDDDLDLALAENAANYQITAAGADETFGTADDVPIAVSNIEYDASADRITVRTVDAFFDALVRLEIDGDDETSEGTPGVTDLAGNHLAGGDFATTFDLRALNLIEVLLAKTEALGLSTGAENSLTAKLNVALHLLGIESADEQGFVAKLESFIHGVTLWHDRGQIDLEDRDELIADAEFIIFGLSVV